jgi:hypothetical protein
MKRFETRNYLPPLFAVGALLLMLFTPSQASAGQFTVAMCGDQSAAAHSFKFDRNSIRFHSAAACGGSDSAGLKLEVEQGRTSGSRWGRWRTVSPSSQLPIVAWSLRARIRDSDGLVGRICFERTSVGTRCFGDDTNGSYRLHGAVAPDGEAIALRLGCFMEKGCQGGKDAHLFARNMRLTVADRIAPALDLSGPLVSPGLKAGETFVGIAAQDRESGIHRMDVTVNGVAVESRIASGCREISSGTFAGYSPCPTESESAIALDTEMEPFVDGVNRVEVCVSDVSSPGLSEANRTCQTTSIEVDNSCPSSPTRAASFRAGIGPGLDQSPTLEYGSSPELSGRVTALTGAPVSGAVICVQERLLGSDGAFRELAEMRSGSDGRFAMRLGVGPSREIRLIQRSGSVIWVSEVTVRVRTRPSIRLSRARLKGGGCVQISGFAPGPQNGGVVMGLQGRAKGSSRWMTFGDAVTRSDGTMTYRYCFRSTSTTTVYELRAVVRDQGIYPYLGGTSAVRRVRVSVR